jgi:hypothetical protein
VAAYVHHASPVIIFVETIDGVAKRRQSAPPITITPVALFDQQSDKEGVRYSRESGFGYTFVQSRPDERQIADAADWIERYAAKHGGQVITNFDERSPILANAPLSYQRLVSRTYDRVLINHFHLEKLADRIDAAVSTEYNNYGQVGAMGDGARSDNNAFLKGSRRPPTR